MAEEFEGEFECLGENTEKYITFSVPIKNEITKKDKNGNDKITKISYKIIHAYKSKYNLTRENQVILLMMTDGEKWHYLAAKRFSALFREITGNNHGDFYCLNCF